MIQTFQSIIERDLRKFCFWILIMIAAWFLLIGINSLQDYFQGRAVRAMNNLAVSTPLLNRYSWLKNLSISYPASRSFNLLVAEASNDVNQIESLAWNPFYQCVDSAATVVFRAIA